jgi:hypothetical protein
LNEFLLWGETFAMQQEDGKDVIPEYELTVAKNSLGEQVPTLSVTGKLIVFERNEEGQIKSFQYEKKTYVLEYDGWGLISKVTGDYAMGKIKEMPSSDAPVEQSGDFWLSSRSGADRQVGGIDLNPANLGLGMAKGSSLTASPKIDVKAVKDLQFDGMSSFIVELRPLTGGW